MFVLNNIQTKHSKQNNVSLIINVNQYKIEKLSVNISPILISGDRHNV